jgi:hypothetical protein
MGLFSQVGMYLGGIRALTEPPVLLKDALDRLPGTWGFRHLLHALR